MNFVRCDFYQVQTKKKPKLKLAVYSKHVVDFGKVNITRNGGWLS